MSKSLTRVRTALAEAGLTPEIAELGETRTAEQAAAAVGCALDQIAKSIIFMGAETGRIHLFLTAGGNRVDAAKATTVAGEPMGKADATQIRAQTGFAIGGVAPLGHLTPCPGWCDPRLMDFDVVWAAAGTPRHVFPVQPADLIRISGAQLTDFTS
ncbi:MAG: YbaK/EbsC family protein [Pseudomonadota bacterium]